MEKGQRIGRYQLLEKIGRGGMAEIFKANEQLSGGVSRTVAIKRLFPKLSADREFVSMFVNEASIAASMDHPNIVRTYDLINYGSYYYMVMEYLEGLDLEELVIIRGGGSGFLSLAEVAYCVHQVALGLGYAHGRRGGKSGGPVVHRDISPGNILAGVDGRLKITDFGIARALQYASFTRPGVLKGKYEYMAPEYVKGKSFDGRADLFSLGVVLYELLAGKSPFADVTPQQIWKRIVEYEPEPPSRFASGLPPAMDRLVRHALAKEPGARFQSGVEFAEALEEFFARPGRERVAAAVGQKVAQVLGGDSSTTSAGDFAGFLPAAEERGENTREVYLDELLDLVEPADVPAPPLFGEGEPTDTRREIKSRRKLGRRRMLLLLGACGAAALAGAGGLIWWRRWQVGWLSVGADLATEIFIDGESLGKTPLEKVRLAEGKHLIEARRFDGAGSRTFQRIVERGENVRLYVKWKKKKRPRRRSRPRK